MSDVKAVQRPMVCAIFSTCGLARPVATAMAEEGARIILTGQSGHQDELTKVARRCASIGSPAVDLHCVNISDTEEIDKLWFSIESRQGYVDVLVLEAEAFRHSVPAAVTDQPEDEPNPAVRLLTRVADHFRQKPAEHTRYIICTYNSDIGNPAAADPGLRAWFNKYAKGLEEKSSCKVTIIDVAGVTDAPPYQVAKVMMMPFSKEDHEVFVKLEQLQLDDEEDRKDMRQTPMVADWGEEGVDPGPSEEGTMRAKDPSEAVYITPGQQPFGGLIGVSGERKTTGLLTTEAHPGDIVRAKADKVGAVMSPADPANLEPDVGGVYQHEPERDYRMQVQCLKPFNGDTPHAALAESWITPAPLHYVRNHLPVPERVDIREHKITINSNGVPGIKSMEVTVQDLKDALPLAELFATLECAGNRRVEMCAVHTVEGRAPWNHGAIGNSKWRGVWLRDVLAMVGLPVDSLLRKDPAPAEAKHVEFQGLDWHRKSKVNFAVSIPIDKAVDPLGDCMVAWEQNGEELTMDHGYPVRVIIPGYVGTRSVKWLSRITISAEESQSDWQQKDYKQLPPMFKHYTTAKPGMEKLPPIMNQPTNSAILVPEAGSVIGRDVKAIRVKGYAWCGAGIPIIRVDVSADDGKTWEMADITQSHMEPHGRMWSWSTWEIPLQVPPKFRKGGGRMSVCCKAWNRNYDTQPRTAEEIWNFRGLNCNSWHWMHIHVQ